jgi:hypothetical protein
MMFQDNLDQIFNVTAPAGLVISNIRGSVEIKPGSEAEIHVSAVKYNDSGDASRTEILLSQAADGSVMVETRYHHSGIFLFGDRPCKVDYVVTVPQRCSVDCSGVSSSSLVHGLQGKFHISTVSGSVQLQDLAGPVHLHTVSGQVLGQSVSGPLDYDTVSGNIRLVDSSLASVKGTSVSASVWLQTSLQSGPYKCDTVSGGLFLLVPPGSACTVESITVSGSLVTDLPVSQDTRRIGHRRTEIDGGGTLVQFNGVSGNISILAGESGQPLSSASQPPAESAKPDHSVDTNSILDKIERGELTVEEGLALIKTTQKT